MYKNYIVNISEPKIYVTILLISVLHVAYGQQSDSLYLMSGQVVGQDNVSPVSFAHIVNVDQKWGVVSDTLGFFNIWAVSGDTLNVSAIGYHYKEFKVEDFSDTLVKIPVENRIYEIREAKISYLGTYKDFEYKVVHLELPDLGINPAVGNIFNYVEPPPLFVEPTVTSPASLMYVLFSKDAKDKKKYIELEKETKIKNGVRERYNKEIVKKITGLEDLEAQRFMKFCGFKDEYILSIDDYNLYSEILLRLDAFKKHQQDSLNIK